MMGKRAGERNSEEQEKAAAAAAAATADAKKRRSGIPTIDGASSGADLCDDVVGNILARVPARTAVASMALSRRHHRLIRSTEFRSLHCRLAPPLPRPHIAYLVTAQVRPPGKDDVPASAFQGFHVAGAGGFNGNSPMPMRALAGRRFSDVAYVNTCNGIVLLAGDKYAPQSRCVLWNPAVADAVEVVSVPGADADASTDVKDYRTLGLGYGRRSKMYKLVLLLCRISKKAYSARGRRKDGSENYYLVTYALADKGKQPTEKVLPAVRGDAEISQHSLYMDGKIYLSHSSLQTYPAAILAFDVDDETVTSIDLPIVHDPIVHDQCVSGLMELSGRPCVVTEYGDGYALWLLSVDHQWQQRCLIGELLSERHIFCHSIVGVWDCGGVIVLCDKDGYDTDRLFLYDNTTGDGDGDGGEMFRANLGSVVSLDDCSESSDDLVLCWGYRPTLQAPSSVVGKLQQDGDRCRECSTYIMKALKPVAEQDRRKGQEATLNTVCFMDFLVRIMQKLPEDMKEVLEMKMTDSDDPQFTFENVEFDD